MTVSLYSGLDRESLERLLFAAEEDVRLCREQIKDLAAEVAHLREALWECVRLSGCDTSDGPPRSGTGDWPQVAELAIREVQQLRDDYDAALSEAIE